MHEGYVELHLKDSARGTQLLKIHIKKPTNAQYYHNDKPITQKELKALVHSYNIQVDNLCTFLAQDKVKSFSEQSPQELLENTLKAASTTLLDERNELMKRQKEEGNLEKMMDETKKKMKQTDSLIETLEPRVQNYLKKQAMQSRLTLITKKKAIVAHRGVQARYEKEIDKVKDIQSKVDKSHKLVEEKQKKVESLEKQKGIFDADMNKARSDSRSSKQMFNNCENNSRYKADVAEIDREYGRTKERANKWESENDRLKTQLDAQKEALTEAEKEVEGYKEANDEYTKRMHEINKEEERIDTEYRGLQKEWNDIMTKKQKLNDDYNQIEKFDRERFAILRNRYHQTGAGQAWEWYLKNIREFECPVYVPLLHMKLVNQSDAMYLENLISARDFAMFIFGSKNDERKLMKAGQWRIASTVVHPREIRDFSTALPSDFAQHGITRMAADLFTAPPPLFHFFCEANQLHRVPICPNNVDIDNVSKRLIKDGMKLFLTSSQRVMVNVSRYSGETVTQMSALRMNAGILVCHDANKWPTAGNLEAAMAEVRRREQEIGRKREALHESKNAVDDIKNKEKQAMTQWRNRKQRLETVKMAVKEWMRKLDTNKKSKPNMEEAKRACEEGKNQLEKNERARIKQMMKYLVDNKKAMIKYLNISMVVKDLLIGLTTARREKDDEYEIWIEYKREYEIKSRELNAYKDKASLTLASFKKETGLSTYLEEKMNSDEVKRWKDLQKKFTKEKLPDSFDELREEEENEKGRIQCVQNDGDEQDLLKLEELQGEKLELERTLNEQSTRQRNRREKMEEDIDKWLEPVNEIIAKINKNYGAFFERLGCTGEIDLDKPEDGTRMTDYGIRIMVKFREADKLRRLDHQVQSGGERSVSTMLYLLALQEECPVPFRCVDEINQGMDPTNERKVFDVMVEKLSGSGNLGKSQYFLLTPKLLSGLKFTKAVTLQIVHNGASLDRHAHKWDASSFLQRMRRDKADREAGAIPAR
ncbi:smc-5 [Pristionchus pacificus]|nr:smc-5 [Pristionchus pacificus]